ncbi:MAG: nitroreductase family protein [Nitrososphaerota archaeon]|nr:nitroreductase family protein [Candidatus Bathyarchaeota archaeon]MDW8023333.1 nitroreductase family protein [Nitrososphaerota archaeon]
MNETIRVIKSRRSIRKFKHAQIPDSELQEIMECAVHAPNARNQQRWYFTVIQNRNVLDEMVNIMKENMLNSGIEFFASRAKDPSFDPFGGAPTVVLVTGDKTARFVEVDCALAAENILLAAESLGLGSHIMTSTELIFASEKGRKLKDELGVPEGYEHICTIALGYKDEEPEAKPRRRDVISFIK